MEVVHQVLDSITFRLQFEWLPSCKQTRHEHQNGSPGLAEKLSGRNGNPGGLRNSNQSLFPCAESLSLNSLPTAVSVGKSKHPEFEYVRNHLSLCAGVWVAFKMVRFDFGVQCAQDNDKSGRLNSIAGGGTVFPTW